MADSLCRELNELREENILCDTTIRSQGQEFPAHRCVLSAASQYFRALFTSQLKGTITNVVELQEAKPTTISDGLRFIYTGKANIDSSNAQDLVIFADYLIIPSLKTKASLFLKGSVEASNCLALETFASLYNCDSLKEAVVTYKLEHFAAVSKSADFKGLDSEKVKELICSDELDVAEEEEVYEAVIAWVKHDLPLRECLLPELLKCVRLCSVSKNNLQKILKEELVSKNPDCMKMVSDTLDFLQFPDCYQGMPLKPRFCLEKHVVVLTGGVDNSGVEKQDTWCFMPSTMTWASLPTMPCYCSTGNAAVCGGQLYVLGEGEPDANLNRSPLMCRFNPKQNTWCCHGITLNRIDFSLVSFNEELYIIGGETPAFQTLSDVQIYNPTLDEWRQGASMETRRTGHNGVVLQNRIYVIGGTSDGGVCLNSVECYNPFTDQWNNVSNMSKVRQLAAAMTVCEKIFVFGGFVDDDYSTIECSREIYDPSTNEWSLISGPRVPRAACGAVCVDNMVYLFGGNNENAILKAVECFDVRSYKWHMLSPFTNNWGYMQASLLKLPKKYIW